MNELNFNKYYIRRTNKFLIRWEIFHNFNNKEIFDSYALTKYGAEKLARVFVFEKFIEII